MAYAARTALSRAVRFGNTAKVQALLQAPGADPGLMWYGGPGDLLSLAVQGDHVGVVRVLLEWVLPNGRLAIDPRRRSGMALRLAARRGCLPIVQALLAWRAKDGKHWIHMEEPDAFEAMRAACCEGHVAVAHALSECVGPDGARMDLATMEASELLTEACRRNHLGIVQLLLTWRGPEGQWVDPRQNGESATRAAVVYAGKRVVCTLLQWRGPGGERVSVWEALYASCYICNETTFGIVLDAMGRDCPPGSAIADALQEMDCSGHMLAFAARVLEQRRWTLLRRHWVAAVITNTK